MTLTSDLLTVRQRAIVTDVLRPYKSRITRAALFGSRAMGTARPSSDIDLALWGDLTEKDVSNIAFAFEDSYLEVTVDVIAYPLLDHAGMRRHIDLVALDIPLDAHAEAGAAFS